MNISNIFGNISDLMSRSTRVEDCIYWTFIINFISLGDEAAREKSNKSKKKHLRDNNDGNEEDGLLSLLLEIVKPLLKWLKYWVYILRNWNSTYNNTFNEKDAV